MQKTAYAEGLKAPAASWSAAGSAGVGKEMRLTAAAWI